MQTLERQCSEFVKAEDFVVSPDAKDLYTASDIHMLLRMPKNEFNKYVEAGHYLPSKYSQKTLTHQEI